MPSLNYDNIYSCFLGKITDYNFANLSTDDAYNMMSEYLHSTFAEPYIRRLFSSIIMDDELMLVTFELENSVDEYADADFIKEIIARGMVIRWLEPKVKSILNISQMFGGKEQKFYSQSNHLNELQAMLKSSKADLRRIICDHGYINNSYLRGE